MIVVVDEGLNIYIYQQLYFIAKLHNSLFDMWQKIESKVRVS